MRTRNGVEYEFFLDLIGDVTPVNEPSHTTLRHDVDHDLEVALRMARIEHARGVRSTYYLLTPPWGEVNYLGEWKRGFTFSTEAKAGIAELLSYGHEVGYHNNLVTVSRASGKDPLAHLAAVVKAFAAVGIAPIGTASHGDREAGQGGYVNYDCLKGVDLTEHGLAYEAYWLPRIGYVSDSGGRLSLTDNGPTVTTVQEPTPDDFARLVSRLKRPAQVLMHPWWWRF